MAKKREGILDPQVSYLILTPLFFVFLVSFMYSILYNFCIKFNMKERGQNTKACDLALVMIRVKYTFVMIGCPPPIFICENHRKINKIMHCVENFFFEC